MEKYAAFLKIIKDFISLFEELIPIEQAKLDAAVKNQISFVEECLNKEQAAILRLRGLEQKRESEQERLGLAGYPFRRILEEAPEAAAAELEPLFKELSGKVAAFRSVSESAKNAIQINLHTIRAALNAGKAGTKTYSPEGHRKGASDNAPRFTSRSV